MGRQESMPGSLREEGYGMKRIGIALAAAAALACIGSADALAADRIDVYPLDTCAVAKSKLGGMGEPVVIRHEGREFRFCCDQCKPKFEADPAKFIASVDERIIAAQRKSYPLTICPVSGEELDEKAHEFVVNNRLVRTCCKDCAKKVVAAPERILAKIDAALVETQKKDYPLETCPVSGEKLSEAAAPVEVLVGHRLVRLCCADCKEQVSKDPGKVLAAVEAAWAGKAGTGAGAEPKPAEKKPAENAPEEAKPAEKKPESGAKPKPPAPGGEE
jgi:hypothetical protein